MDSEETKKLVVTPANWRQFGDRIHTKACEKMGIEQGSLDEAIFLALAAGGEMGELQNVVKKMWRDGQDQELSVAVAKEAADVLIYMDHFLNAFRLQATAIIVAKLQELVDRWPEYFEGWEPAQTTVQ